MINSVIQQKIKRIKIHTSRIMQSTLTGDYLSAFKGSGLEFNQIREYTLGDDIRSIDWNSSAKINKIMVKQFIEERERTIILAIDVSASNNISSKHELRKESIANLAATLTLLAQQNKDNVGALFFSDVIELWIPPSKNKTNIAKIIETIYTISPRHQQTNIAHALRFLVSTKKRNAIVFMLSDWIDESRNYESLLRIASYKFDFIGMRMTDQIEMVLPDIGFLEVQDSESNTTLTIDTRNIAKTHHLLAQFLLARHLGLKRLFQKYRIDLVDLTVGRPFVHDLITFFHNRTRRQV